jgi:enoyl-CoA hydratase
MIETSFIENVRVLRLAHGKASALDLELVVALTQALKPSGSSEADATVLTGTGHIFCAGVDLFRIAGGGADYVRRYLAAFKDLMLALFTCERPLIVAANGHAIAGGAVLVSGGDYRLMASGTGRFGYTELLVGVPFPPAALEIIRFATPPRQLKAALYTGATYPAEQAFARGFIDELAAPEKLMPRALELATQFGRIPRAAFIETKRHLRASALAAMHEYERIYADEVLAQWSSDKTREDIRAYLASTVRRK